MYWSIPRKARKINKSMVNLSSLLYTILEKQLYKTVKQHKIQEKKQITNKIKDEIDSLVNKTIISLNSTSSSENCYIFRIIN